MRITLAYFQMVGWLDRLSGLLPLMARVVFAGVLAPYFWASAATKWESFPFNLSIGAYAQIFPRAFEAAGYDVAALSFWHKAIAMAGSYAEIILPLALILGLATRWAALGMMGFVLVQTAVDIWGHQASAATIGMWFDSDSGSLLADQRALWAVLLAILVLRGAGALSMDRLFAGRFGIHNAGTPPPPPLGRI